MIAGYAVPAKSIIDSKDVSMVIYKWPWLFFFNISATLLVMAIILKFLIKLLFPTDVSIGETLKEKYHTNLTIL